MMSLQRGDLHLENFDQATFTGSVGLSLVLLPQLTVAANGGVERRFLFALQEAGASSVVGQTPTAQTRPYAEVLVDAVFNPQDLRIDRKHELEGEARWYTGSPSSRDALWLRAHYQHRIASGWHELWVSAAGTYLLGQVLCPDEDSIGKYLNGPFSTTVFARSLAAAGAEFRFSLIREALKVGLFYDQVVFGAIDRSGGPTKPATAGAGGPSLHLLLADEIEAGGYLSFGLRSGGIFDFAASLIVRQVY
jgi:hypothetical protein